MVCRVGTIDYRTRFKCPRGILNGEVASESDVE